MTNHHSIKSVLLIGFLFCLAAQVAQAETVRYTITGEIPTGASTHSMVADGETFTGIFLADLTTPDLLDDGLPGDDEFGLFFNAISGGTLEFSGGYVSTIDFSDYTISIFDNSPVDGFGYDGIQIGEPTSEFRAQVNNFDDPNAVTSDSLPGVGSVVNSAPGIAPTNVLAFEYEDALGAIGYSSLDANNVTLTVTSAVPEPTSCAILMACTGLALTGRRRHK